MVKYGHDMEMNVFGAVPKSSVIDQMVSNCLKSTNLSM